VQVSSEHIGSTMSRHCTLAFIALFLAFSPVAFSQTFRRLGTCPTLGCVFPPDQTEFLAGQLFDIRLETHAPTSGREATNGIPDENFTFCIQKGDGQCEDAAKFFKVQDAPVEKWNFTQVFCVACSAFVTDISE
jgi:hypothetical protein